MAAVKDKKLLGAPASQSIELVRVVYDFSKDAGATGSLDLFEADVACCVKLRYALVQVAATSGGSATISAGKASAGTEFLNASAVAGFSLGAVVNPASQNSVKLAAGEKIDMTIATAALTAGKIEFVLEIGRF